VIGVVNGKDGLDYFHANPDKIDLVITDLTMPVMTGKELLQKIHERFDGLPVIVSIGYSFDLDSFATETGNRPDAVVCKPFTMEEMLLKVEECLSQPPPTSAAA
jgi:DNA-binding NtrC family response regulator